MFVTCFSVCITLAQIEQLMAECYLLMSNYHPSFSAVLRREMGEHWTVRFIGDSRDCENLLALYQLNRKYTVVGHSSLMPIV